MEPDSRVLSGAELIRWALLAIILVVGVVSYFSFSHEAAPFHPMPAAANAEGHR